MTHIILHIILLYVHSNISTIHLVVITQVILHSFAGHQGLPISPYAKLTSTISDTCTQRPECSVSLVATSKNVNFFPVTMASPV